MGEAAEGPGTARWSLADAVLLDEAADLVERTPSLAHIVADEAQDLSPMMLRALGPALLDRLADRARRPRPGDHAVGHPVLGRGARPPRQARRPRRAAHPRVPGARRGDRVRRPAAAADRPRPRAADVGPALPGELSIVSAPALLDVVGAAVAREGSVGLIVPDALAARSVPTSRRPGSGSRCSARRPRRRGRDRVRPAPRPGAGHAREGPGVRPRRAARARRHRRR